MTLNREKLLELARIAGDVFESDRGCIDIEFDDHGLVRFYDLLLSAAQEERETALRIEFVDRGVSPGLHIRKWDCLTDLPAGTYDFYLKRPLQAQEQKFANLDGGEVMRSAHAWCPTDLSHLDRMRWMADFFIKNYQPKAQSASGAVDDLPSSSVTDEQRSLSSLLIDVAALLASFVEDGKSLKRYEARSVLSRVRAARATLSRAQAAPDEVQAAEAKLYRDLTGDAMAMGYDGIPAALEAIRAWSVRSKTDSVGKMRAALYAITNTLDDGELRKAAQEAYDASFQVQAAQQAQPVSNEAIRNWMGKHDVVLKNEAYQALCALLSQSAAPSEQETTVKGRITSWLEDGKECVGEQPAAQMAVPEGFVLVNVKPNKAQKSILKDVAPRWNAESIYQNLLADADVAPSPQGGDK